ncbi:hypothetical protein GR11A_00250 [Vibrio phage vB_VcorM_GR11A]|nr:hypothetical protein GR11A_00250 [Vibrio phage vB_VcorM_GR11A]
MKHQEIKSPLATIAATNGGVEQQKQDKDVETAALTNDAPEVCPVCKKPMKQVLANGIPSVVCMEHRVCLPRVDS